MQMDTPSEEAGNATCAVLHDEPTTGRIAIYYGGADTVTALAFCRLDEVQAWLRPMRWCDSWGGCVLMDEFRIGWVGSANPPYLFFLSMPFLTYLSRNFQASKATISPAVGSVRSRFLLANICNNE